MTTAAQMRDRTALVTGAGTGIGAALAERLAALGAHLVLVARTADTLDRLAERLTRQYGVRALAIPLDLAGPQAPGLLAQRLADAGIEVELLVNNAGVALGGPVAETDPARLRALLDLNAGALTELTARLLPAMIGRGHGSVVNIASTGAYVPAPFLAAYAASKAYVLSFTAALWAETKDTGVRVVVVSPGATRTPMNTAGNGRSPDAVAGTVLKALAASGPTAIDGPANRWSSHVFSTLLTRRASASIARRLVLRRTSS